jgi:hypothetical protein
LFRVRLMDKLSNFLFLTMVSIISNFSEIFKKVPQLKIFNLKEKKMKSKLLVYSLPVFLVAFLLYGYSIQDDPARDIAPVYNEVVGGNPTPVDTTTPAGFPYTRKWSWNYETVPNVSAGTVGACYFKGKYYLNRWNNAELYLYDDDGPGGGPGTLTNTITGYNGGTGAIRDMTVAPDGSGREYLWGGAAGTILYKLDSAGTRIASYTHAGAAYRAVAWDASRKGFWSCNFTGNIVCRDTTGTILRTVTNTLGGKYGLAWDSTSSQDSAFLWVWSQDFTVPTDTANTLQKIYLGPGTSSPTVGQWTFNKVENIAGGAEIFEKDNELILSLNYQNFAVVGYKLKDLGPPPPVGNTLVIYNDSTGSTTQRTSDRDTLRKYVNIMIDNVTYMTKNTTTVFPDLSGYSTIIFQETSFDVVAVRDLSASQRTAIKDWLASGTPTSKKSLIMIGADMGYSYSRAGSLAQDLVLSGTYGGFEYINDNAATSATFASVSKSPPGTHFDVMSTSPPGSSYWPDGCRTTSGGTVFERYLGRSTGDTLAGISNTGAGWNVISTFQDPRYYTGLGDDDGTGYRGFNRVLFNMVKWVLENQGIITNVNPGMVSTIADIYELSQNYPNPFNPATTINFSIPKSGLVTLKIYDMLGKEVATLVNELRNAGSHSIDFNASALSSGTYFYRIESGNFRDVKKMMLIK